MSGPAIKVKADDVASLFRKEIQDIVGKMRMVNISPNSLSIIRLLIVRIVVSLFISQRGITPLLVGFLANGDVAAKKYAEVSCILIYLPKDTKSEFSDFSGLERPAKRMESNLK
jgi:predicted oxidoreductase